MLAFPARLRHAAATASQPSFALPLATLDKISLQSALDDIALGETTE